MIGFPLGFTGAYLLTLAIRGLDLTPDGFSPEVHPNTEFIAHPDEFTFLVAVFAGIVGVLSLTNAKSGALVGVLISVTTIPAAANVGLALAFQDIDEWLGALAQLAVNLTAIALAGIITLFIQRKIYQRRRRAHLHEEAREAAGLPVGESRKRVRVGGVPPN
jgi:uncharacterized membrane protein